MNIEKTLVGRGSGHGASISARRLEQGGDRWRGQLRRLRIVSSDPHLHGASESTGAPRSTRTVVGAKHYLVREGISAVLAHRLSFDVVGSAADGESLRALIEREEADLVVCELSMPPSGAEEGLEIARWLRRARSEASLVLIGDDQDAGLALRLLEAGPARRGYIVAADVTGEADLAAVVLEVAAGGFVIDSSVFAGLSTTEGLTAAPSLGALSARKRQVLEGIAEGKSNAAIARSLQLSKASVEKHISSIFETLELPSEEDVSRRVVAALLFLSERDG